MKLYGLRTDEVSNVCRSVYVQNVSERQPSMRMLTLLYTYRRDPLCDSSAEARVPEEKLNYQHVKLSGKVSPLHRVYTGLWGVYLPTRSVVRPCECFVVC